MKVEVFVLCDAATDNRGKLNILGAFDNILGKQVPVVHPACAVALRLRFSRIEQGSYKIKINIVDQDGKSVIPPLEQDITVRMRNDMDSAAANMILNIQGLKLNAFGDYQIGLAIDNREEASLPLHLKQIPNQS